jgi:hypothetical protein
VAELLWPSPRDPEEGAVPIVADIYDLPAAEFLLMLSLNRKTGKLTGVSGEHKVMVAVQDGSIVYAASTSTRERIGSLLVSRGLVTEAQVQAALERHTAEGQRTLLGNILVEMGAISAEALAEVVGSQFQKVVEELLAWDEGTITFHRMEIPDVGAVQVDPREILTGMGFSTEQLVIGGMSMLEDSARDAASEEARETMRSIIDEGGQLAVALTAEVTQEILAGASAVVDRSVLLLVAPDSIRGAGGIGVQVAGLSNEEVVRHCVIPRDQESVFTQVIAAASPYFGALEYTAANGLFVDQLGGAKPEGVVVAPLVYEGKVVALLYGDNAPGNRSIEAPERLAELMHRAAARLGSSSEV